MRRWLSPLYNGIVHPVLTQARLAAVNVPEDADIDIKHARAAVITRNS